MCQLKHGKNSIHKHSKTYSKQQNRRENGFFFIEIVTALIYITYKSKMSLKTLKFIIYSAKILFNIQLSDVLKVLNID